MKALYEAPHYKNETRKMIKESLIRQEWQDAKSELKNFYLIQMKDITNKKMTKAK